MKVFVVTAFYGPTGGGDADAVVIAVASSVERAEEIGEQHTAAMEALAKEASPAMDRATMSEAEYKAASIARNAHYEAVHFIRCQIAVFELDEHGTKK
jgi:hypothetical protein